jgi:hypothetical protein
MLTVAEKISNSELQNSTMDELVVMMEQEHSQMDCSKIHVDNYNRILKEIRSRNKGR